MLHWNQHVKFKTIHVSVMFIERYFWTIDGVHFLKIILKNHIISTKTVQCTLQCTCTIWVSKNAEFDAYFESAEKAAKKLMWKKLSTKKWQENGIFLTFFLFAKVFHFLGEIFSTFFELNYACYDSYIELFQKLFFLIIALFTNFQAKIGQRNEKRFL